MPGSPSNTVTAFAPAKINLYLQVTGRRDDGYHLLDSLIVFADIGDQISATSSDQLKLTIEGPFAKGLSSGDNNLVIRAANILAEFADIEPRANITLTKNLPVASGIGGGSADAAATLHALTELWQLTLSKQDLLALAQKLGSDVPVCVHGKPSFISGIGEIITPAPDLPEAWLVLVNPGIAISTPEVFAGRNGDFSKVSPFATPPPAYTEFAALLNERRNDLTVSAIAIAPEIQEALSALDTSPGQNLCRMCGSGATCFGLFEDEIMAQKAADDIQTAHPTWWIRAARLRS